MPSTVPQIVKMDDIVVRRLAAGHYLLTPPSVHYRNPHRCSVLLMDKGDLVLEDGHRNRLDIQNSNSIIVFPWQPYRLTTSNRVLSIEVPSYRLSTCSLTPLSIHRFSAEQTYLLDTLMGELLANTSLLQSDAQRFIASALSSMVSLPEPDECRHEQLEKEGREASLCNDIARIMCDRMHDASLRAEEVGSSLGISRAQLYRALSPYGGFKTCLQAQRLDKVARHLKSPANDALSIKSILFKCGFSTTEQFQRLFQKRFSVSARDFRRGRPAEPDTFQGFRIEPTYLIPEALTQAPGQVAPLPERPNR